MDNWLQHLVQLYCFYFSDDVWIISKSLSFNKESTFIASSVYYGPSSSRELEIVPIRLETPNHLQRKGKNAFHSWILLPVRIGANTLQSISNRNLAPDIVYFACFFLLSVNNMFLILFVLVGIHLPTGKVEVINLSKTKILRALAQL